MSQGQSLNANQAERVHEAEKLLRAGTALVPVPLGRKGPVTKNWNERSACVTDPSEAEIFANKNIGLAHAYADPSPWLRELAKATIHQREALELFALPRELLDALERDLERHERWSLTVSDGALYVTRGDATYEGELERLFLD